MNIKSAHLLTALAGRIVRQVGRNFRPNISADFAEIFGRIFGFGRTLLNTHEYFVNYIQGNSYQKLLIISESYYTENKKSLNWCC